jgi:WD40 repeat protein
VEDDRNSRSVSPSKPRFALDGTPLPPPRPSLLKTLIGRNVLLGTLIEATFTAIAAISDQRAVICSEKGDVCLLDDSDGQKLMKIANTGFWITCLAVDLESGWIRIGGKNGQVKVLGLNDLLVPVSPSEFPVSVLEAVSPDDTAYLCAMGYSAGSLITVDSKHSIEISNLDQDPTNPAVRTTPFPAHGDAVLGVRLLCQPNKLNAAFLTWSADGSVVFWDLNGSSKASLQVRIEQLASLDDDTVNQCLIVRSSKDAAFLVAGDRYGVLRIINSETKNCTFDARAHISDIHDIAIFESLDTTLIATCGRDRTIQLFRHTSKHWELTQTLDDHSASVCSLLFAENGEKLISCSTDRTIHIRQLVKNCVDGHDMIGAVPVRIITLKASPISMVACLDDGMRNFVVSLLDRTVATYEIASGRLVSSFRATDAEGSDAVALDALHIGAPSSSAGRPTILAGVSSTDKSVRVYDAVTGSFLDREWGHTTAVTDVALLESPDSEQKTLISTGSDGTIMIWDLSPKPQEDFLDFVREISPTKDTSSARPPLRRVLSKAELAEFQRASPVTTPTGRSSPPRSLRKKTSRYGLSSQSPIPPMPISSKHFTSTSDDSVLRRGSPRGSSRSPPASPKAREVRRPSLADSRGRTKSTGNFGDLGTLQYATEQTCRALRTYRKKLVSSETVKDDTLKELDQELRLTAVALGEKSLKSRAISETVLSGLLDQYSDRLVSMFDEKLRLTMEPKSLVLRPEDGERPQTAGNPLVVTNNDRT